MLARVVLVFGILLFVSGNIHYFKKSWGPYDSRYSTFSEKERLHMLSEAKQMFQFGYDNYMRYAFPKDELDPIHCTGRGPDVDNPYVDLNTI